jgi:hypothetical protein
MCFRKDVAEYELVLQQPSTTNSNDPRNPAKHSRPRTLWRAMLLKDVQGALEPLVFAPI